VINLEEAVIRKLKTAQHILCTVESCTGGLIAHWVTNVPGSSEVYWGSYVTYDNSAKEELGVPRLLMSQHGAVSSEVARALAESGLKRLQDNPFQPESRSLLKPRGIVCVATTGIAGPTGGTPGKPVGLCYIALAITGRKTIIEDFRATVDDRVAIKGQFAQRALELIRESF